MRSEITPDNPTPARTRQQKKPGARPGFFPTEAVWTSRLALLLHEVRDDQRVDDERLDECETDDHGQTDRTGSARIPCDAFHGGGNGPGLTDGTGSSRNPQQKRRGNETPSNSSGG